MKNTVKINSITVPKRIAMPPMATEKSEGGKVTDALCHYYQKRCKNPYLGMVITEHMYIRPDGKKSPGMGSIASDEDIEGLSLLVKTMHEANPEIKVFCQINHGGLRCTEEVSGYAPVGPSDLDIPGWKGRAFTAAELPQLADDYAKAALRAKKAGYDGVEVHSAHGYLLNQFYSPYTNTRTDEYGPQSMENRLRLHKEVLEKVRAAVGPDYPVIVRLGGCDYDMEGGSTEEDAVLAAKLLESYGADLIDVTGGCSGYVRKNFEGPGTFAAMSKKIKEAVSVPVLCTGGVTTPQQAQQLLDEGVADIIGIGRSLLTNANWGMEE